jgi:hypothetical protein
LVAALIFLGLALLQEPQGQDRLLPITQSLIARPEIGTPGVLLHLAAQRLQSKWLLRRLQSLLLVKRKDRKSVV